MDQTNETTSPNPRNEASTPTIAPTNTTTTTATTDDHEGNEVEITFMEHQNGISKVDDSPSDEEDITTKQNEMMMEGSNHTIPPPPPPTPTPQPEIVVDNKNEMDGSSHTIPPPPPPTPLPLSSDDVVITNDMKTEGSTTTATNQPNDSSVISSTSSDENNKAVAATGGRDGQQRALEDEANCISLWLLNYLTPLLRLGSSKLLDQNDVGQPPDQDRSERAYMAAIQAWEEQTKKCNIYNQKMKAAYEKKLSKCTTEEQRQKLKPPVEREPSIAASLVRSFGRVQLVLGAIYYVIGALLSFVPVLILRNLVRFFQHGGNMEYWTGFFTPWVEVVLLGVVPILVSILQTRHQVIMAHCAVFVRTAVSTMLYRKALRVSAAGRSKTSTGQVVNMMSNDTSQLQRFLQFVGMTAVAPIQIVIALILINQQVGAATWVGVGFMIFLAPINTVVFSIVSKQRRKVLQYSDLRVKMMNEILNGIRIIKFYAWERPFGSEVGRLRSKELAALTRLAYTSAVGFSLILLSAPIIQPILVFLTYIAIYNKPLDAATAFTTVALFNMMRFPFAFMPMGLLQYIQSKISLRRLERYLDLPELGTYVVPEPPPSPTSSSEQEFGSITVRNGTFSWVDPDAKPIRPIQDIKPKKEKKPKKSKKIDDDDNNNTSKSVEIGSSVHSHTSVKSDGSSTKGPTITLQELNFHIPAGTLVAVVGPVGCGKSSLLSALLGEMESIHDSKVYMPQPTSDGSSTTTLETGRISYCAQTPWVVNDTLRGNVLFGREYNEARYQHVIEACALIDDLAVLPAGDLTEIGERGINLSGGQKARVSLARSLYSSDTKIVFFDDPLSAVDAHVGEHIFSNAINGEMFVGLTRILVTHHVHLLSRCDSVIVLENGRIKHHGPYHVLVEQGVDFAGAIDISKIAPNQEMSSGEQTTEESMGNIDEALKDAKEKNSTDLVVQKDDEVAGKLTVSTKERQKEAGKKLLSTEEREEGSVSTSAYYHYAKAGGWWLVFWMFLIQGVGRACEIMGSFWLIIWADAAIRAARSGVPQTRGEQNFYVGIYALFGMLSVIGLTGRSILIAHHRLGASKSLHDNLVTCILRAPVAFFDVTPTGRVLNRFAADMDKIDLELTQSLSQGISTIFNVLGAIVAIIIGTRGTFLVPLVPISLTYYRIQKWFRKTSTELQRINSIANSPIFADFSMTLSGTSTIRAYGKERLFFNHCKSSFDIMNSSYILVQLTNYWLGLRLDVLGGFISAFIGAIALATVPYNFIPAGWLGLALSYSIEVSNFLKMGVRMIATIEAQMNSVERVLYYTDNVESEASEFTDADPPPSEWPQGGAIELKNASMRYRDGPLVLKDLSLQIKPGEKVGVCGRTGSGKSSLMIALFRISELEDDGGIILVDGINTRELGTTTLRTNLSIIPQDPVIFSNTVRYNIDPFNRHTDDELWQVLKKVQMDEVIGALPKGLLEEVAEGGENFSQGQRQLLCIARSLLRKPKILVMDEATASIDNATDSVVQEMIRENFKDATVLTIAHRLNTIMDSDRVLVLDDGRIAEFASPEELLSRDDSLFKAMTDKSRAAKERGNL